MPSQTDAYSTLAPAPGAPARRAEAVTPHDANDLPCVAKALYLGQGGDVTLIPANGTAAVTLKAHAAGYVAVQTRRVLGTGTTAQQIVALFD